jgi:hypothetical protein
VAREIELHAELSHPGIIGFYAAFESMDSIYLVQEVPCALSQLRDNSIWLIDINKDGGKVDGPREKSRGEVREMDDDFRNRREG